MTLVPNTQTEELYELHISKLFQMSNEFPPSCKIDHQINIVEGAAAVDV